MPDSDNPILKLASALIACPSITPNDAGCMQIIEQHLKPLGFDIDIWQENDTQNLLASLGRGAPYVLYAGHTDVVPPGPIDQWETPPFQASISNEQLYGRGACDMKGGIAAFLCALTQFHNSNKAMNGTLIIAITSDEEGDAQYGTKEIIKRIRQKFPKIDYCLVGEPTCANNPGDTIKIGRRGSLNGFANLQLQQGHVAYATPQNNVIHRSADLINQLNAISPEHLDPHFPPTSFHITYLNAGDGTTNVVPGQIDLQFNFRYPPSVSHIWLMEQVNQCFKRTGLEFTINWTHSAKPYFSKPSKLAHLMQTITKKVYGQKADLNTFGGTSDGRFLIDLECELIEFGLQNTTIHQVNEHVCLVDLFKLSLAYENFLEALLT